MKIKNKAISCVFLSVLLIETLFAQRPLSVRQIAASTRPAVVTIYVQEDGEYQANGIGFVMREDGVIITSMRVAAGVDQLRVEFDTGELYDNVYVIGHDERRELLLLQVPAVGLEPLEIADDRSAYVGDAVYAIGSTQGSEFTFSDGILSARQLEDGVIYLQSTAGISANSSGGPIMDMTGQALGVALATSSSEENLTVAVPARYALGLLAFAGDRVPFEDFAAAMNSSTYGMLAARGRQSQRLLANLSASARAQLEVMETTERQVETRQMVAAAPLIERGWQTLETEDSDFLEAGTTGSLQIRLASGRYQAISRCDDNCGELGLSVSNADGEIIVEDDSPGADASVEFEIRGRSDLRIDTIMDLCMSEICRYGVRLYTLNNR